MIVRLAHNRRRWLYRINCDYDDDRRTRSWTAWGFSPEVAYTNLFREVQGMGAGCLREYDSDIVSMWVEFDRNRQYMMGPLRKYDTRMLSTVAIFNDYNGRNFPAPMPTPVPTEQLTFNIPAGVRNAFLEEYVRENLGQLIREQGGNQWLWNPPAQPEQMPLPTRR